MFAFIDPRNFGTDVLISLKSSSETVMKSTACGRYSASIFTRSGNSSRQGSHHVAQKLMSSGRSRSSVTMVLSASVSIGETTTGFCDFAGRPFCFCAGAVKLAKRRQKETAITTRDKRMDNYARLMVQPNAFASVFSIGLPASEASIAFRRSVASDRKSVVKGTSGELR